MASTAAGAAGTAGMRGAAGTAAGAAGAAGGKGAIGFFDSGVGGLSVWRAAAALLPGARTVYLADNAHCPYGRLPPEEILGRARANATALLARGCAMIVVACNTATAAAIDALRAERPGVPFIGMEPPVKPAALGSAARLVGVLATPGTLRGRLFLETSRRYAGRARFLVREVSGWVEAVERGETAPGPETLALVSGQIRPLLEAGVDSLALGCTHFPFLAEAIRAVAGPGVRLYDPAPAVARQIKRVFESLPPAAPDAGPDAAGPDAPPHLFFSTGDPAPLRRMLAAMGLPGPAGSGSVRAWPGG